MKLINRILFCIPLLSIGSVYAQKEFHVIPLSNLDAFNAPGKNWVLGSDVSADYTRNHDLKAVKGEGVVVNNFQRNGQMHLATKDEMGDIEIDLEFLMAKGSNSGVYLQGRYEIQLQDSWMKTAPTSSDAGAVYMRWSPERLNFEGTAPLMNVAKAPGLWQHLNIKFRAPKFDDKGEKIKNARFETVYLNNVLVQQEVEVSGPTASSMFQDEKSLGPLILQGDHGPVAFRNIRYRKIVEPVVGPQRDEYWIPRSNYWNTVDQYIVTPGAKPSFIKTFLMHGDKKLTHVISVGNPNQINYSYDLKQGNIFQVWRGKFLDVTPSWRDRGGMQISVPLGAVMEFDDRPVVAQLQNDQSPWPGALGFDTMNNKGYVLDKTRTPTFSYSFNGLEVMDSIAIPENNEGINRTITISNNPANSYCRIAASPKIEHIKGDLFVVGDRSYYLRIDKKYKPVIRAAAGGQELLVKYVGPVTYSLIW